MRKKLFFIALISTSFASCFQDVYRSILQSELSGSESYDIKSMVSGCCGCKALLVNFKHNGVLTAQFVVETGCGLDAPTKHIFSANSKGRIVAYKSFVAVVDDSFSVAVSEIDKMAFRQLDSIYSAWQSGNKRQIEFSSIKGFKEGSGTHKPLDVKMSSTGIGK